MPACRLWRLISLCCSLYIGIDIRGDLVALAFIVALFIIPRRVKPRGPIIDAAPKKAQSV